MLGTHKLDEILNNTKSTRDKRGFRYKDGLSILIGVVPKFIKLSATDHRTKLVTTAPKYKSVVTSHPTFPNKINTSPFVNSLYYTDDRFLPLPTRSFLFFTIMVSASF